MDNVVVSPSSRRRLNESPDEEIFRAFTANPSMRETLGFELRLPGEGPESKDSEEEENEETSSRDDDIRESISAVYDGMLQQLRMLSPPHSPLQSPVQSPRRPRRPQRPETVMLRIAGNPTPQMVIRLPTGGFSYAPSPVFEVVSPPARRRRSRTADVPLVRQHAPSAAVNQRIRRLRRQLRLSPARRAPSPPPPPPRRAAVLAWSEQAPRSLRLLRSRHPTSAQNRQDEPIPCVLVTPEMGAPPGRCAICLEDFVPNTRLTWVPCQPEGGRSQNDHVFHYTCIREWVHTCTRGGGARTCPECRGVW